MPWDIFWFIIVSLICAFVLGVCISPGKEPSCPLGSAYVYRMGVCLDGASEPIYKAINK